MVVTKSVIGNIATYDLVTADRKILYIRCRKTLFLHQRRRIHFSLCFVVICFSIKWLYFVPFTCFETFQLYKRASFFVIKLFVRIKIANNVFISITYLNLVFIKVKYVGLIPLEAEVLVHILVLYFKGII